MDVGEKQWDRNGMILLKAVVNEWKIQSPAITVFVTAVFCLK